MPPSSIFSRMRRGLSRFRHRDLRRSFRINSHLTDAERVALRDLARLPSVAHVVEIGSYLGASATALAAGLVEKPEAVTCIHCVDTWLNDIMSEGARDTMSEFLSNTRHVARLVRPLRGRSADPDIVRLVANYSRGIDLLFVDGDHSYEGVSADWAAYGPLLSAGAIVAFHDYGWAEGVRRVVDSEVAPRCGTQTAMPNLWWGVLNR